MFIITLTIFMVDTYSSIYSILLFGWANEQCYLQDTVWVKSLSTFFERLCQYVVWVYPILWLLWPTKISCRRRRRDLNNTQASIVDTIEYLNHSTTVQSETSESVRDSTNPYMTASNEENKGMVE